MDTGEFVAIDVPEDELRRVANVNRQRAEELGAALSSISRRIHNQWHNHGAKPYEECHWYTCREARRALAA
jgi:hypothetical protein